MGTPALLPWSLDHEEGAPQLQRGHRHSPSDANTSSCGHGADLGGRAGLAFRDSHRPVCGLATMSLYAYYMYYAYYDAYCEDYAGDYDYAYYYANYDIMSITGMMCFLV